MEALVDPMKNLCIQKRDFNLNINIDPDSVLLLNHQQAQLCIARFFWGSHPLEDLTSTVWLASPDVLVKKYSLTIMVWDIDQ